jgi:hypothetical protein
MAKKKKLTKAQAAVIDHFNQSYGQDAERLTAWNKLCQDVGVAEGTSINQCKKVSFRSQFCIYHPKANSDLESSWHLH